MIHLVATALGAETGFFRLADHVPDIFRECSINGLGIARDRQSEGRVPRVGDVILVYAALAISKLEIFHTEIRRQLFQMTNEGLPAYLIFRTDSPVDCKWDGNQASAGHPARNKKCGRDAGNAVGAFGK